MEKRIEKALALPPAEAVQRLVKIVLEVKTANNKRKNRKTAGPSEDAIKTLLLFFVNDQYDAQVRRWAAVLLFEFLSTSSSAQDAILQYRDSLARLGVIVLEQHIELSLLAASLIAAAEPTRSVLSAIWPKSKFPDLDVKTFSANCTGRSWLADVTKFITRGQRNGDGAFQMQSHFLVVTIELDDKDRLEKQGPLCGIIGQDRFTIFSAPASEASPLFIDVEYASVSDVLNQAGNMADSQTESQEFVPKFSLELRDNEMCSVNGKEQRIDSIMIFLCDRETCQTSVKSISAMLSKRGTRRSVGETLDISLHRRSQSSQSRLPAVASTRKDGAAPSQRHEQYDGFADKAFNLAETTGKLRKQPTTFLQPPADEARPSSPGHQPPVEMQKVTTARKGFSRLLSGLSPPPNPPNQTLGSSGARLAKRPVQQPVAANQARQVQNVRKLAKLQDVSSDHAPAPPSHLSKRKRIEENDAYDMEVSDHEEPKPKAKKKAPKGPVNSGTKRQKQVKSSEDSQEAYQPSQTLQGVPDSTYASEYSNFSTRRNPRPSRVGAQPSRATRTTTEIARKSPTEPGFDQEPEEDVAMMETFEAFEAAVTNVRETPADPTRGLDHGQLSEHRAEHGDASLSESPQVVEDFGEHTTATGRERQFGPDRRSSEEVLVEEARSMTRVESLVDEYKTRKQKVVHWTETGPRNQGRVTPRVIGEHKSIDQLAGTATVTAPKSRSSSVEGEQEQHPHIDDFVPIDVYEEEPAVAIIEVNVPMITRHRLQDEASEPGPPSLSAPSQPNSHRRSSQRITRKASQVTDEGSPIGRTDVFEDYVAAATLPPLSPVYEERYRILTQTERRATDAGISRTNVEAVVKINGIDERHEPPHATPTEPLSEQVRDRPTRYRSPGPFTEVHQPRQKSRFLQRLEQLQAPNESPLKERQPLTSIIISDDETSVTDESADMDSEVEELPQLDPRDQRLLACLENLMERWVLNVAEQGRTAIAGVLDDYINGGSRLIDQLEQDWVEQLQRELHTEKTRRLKDMSKSHRKALDALDQTEGGKRDYVDKLAMWKQSQQQTSRRIEDLGRFART